MEARTFYEDTLISVEVIEFKRTKRFYVSLKDDPEHFMGSISGPLTESQCRSIAEFITWGIEFGTENAKQKMINTLTKIK